MKQHSIWYTDTAGQLCKATGTLPELSQTLTRAKERGHYSGGKVRVVDTAGKTVGWAEPI